MKPSAQQIQNMEEALELMGVFAQWCPKLTKELTGLKKSNENILKDDRLQVDDSIVELGLTTTEWFLTGNYFVTTIKGSMFPGRHLGWLRCDDIDEVVKLMATLIHETYHRRCKNDPDVYWFTAGLLQAMKSCIPEDAECRSQLISSLDNEIQNEINAASPGGQVTDQQQRLKAIAAAIGGGISVGLIAGVIAAGGWAAFKAAAIASGPVGWAVGLGVLAVVVVYNVVSPCE